MVNDKIYELLVSKIPKENILVDESMKKHTSFKIGGLADFFVKATNIDEVKYVIKISKENDIPITIVGNGTNLLVRDEGIRGIVLKIIIDDIKIENIDNDENSVEVSVGCGVPLSKLAQILLKNSISGFEFASGIPGTIGGAVRMNAGAYGSEFKDIVTETTCMNEDGDIFKLSNEEQKFEYRKSIFHEKSFIILESKLLLKRIDNMQDIKDKMEEYKKSRQEKQPLEFPNAGSTFKRGADFITAKLIDECGLKGYSVGGAQVSTKHAGFLVNRGEATAKDVMELVAIVQNKVLEKFKKKIELEIEVIGE